MTHTQTSIFSQVQSDEVLEMTLRGADYSYWVIAALLSCVFLISLARLRQREVFYILLQGTVFFKSYADQQKEGIRQNPFSTVVLVLQYACITALSLYWLNNQKMTQWSPLQQIAILCFPLALLLYNILISSIASFISDSSKLIPEINFITLGLSQALGIVILVEFFFLFFKPEYKMIGNQVILCSFALFYFLRLVRGIYIGIIQGVRWYYLILYFWTLEILPVLILAKILFNQEVSGFIG